MYESLEQGSNNRHAKFLITVFEVLPRGSLDLCLSRELNHDETRPISLISSPAALFEKILETTACAVLQEKGMNYICIWRGMTRITIIIFAAADLCKY